MVILPDCSHVLYNCRISIFSTVLFKNKLLLKMCATMFSKMDNATQYSLDTVADFASRKGNSECTFVFKLEFNTIQKGLSTGKICLRIFEDI